MSESMNQMKREFESDIVEYKLEPIPHSALKQNNRGDGSNTSYYDLPIGAKTLNDLILHKNMNHSLGEAFCAIYRANDNGEYIRNLKKVNWYITELIKYEESKQ